MTIKPGAIWFALAGLLALLLAIRGLERRYAPGLPLTEAPVFSSGPASGMAPESGMGGAPTPLPSGPNTVSPAKSPTTVAPPLEVTIPAAPPPAPLAPEASSNLNAELKGYASIAAALWPPPDLAKLARDCDTDPRGTEKRSGLTFLGAAADGSLKSSVQEALCTASLAPCSDMAFPTQPICGPGQQCTTPMLQLGGGESIKATSAACSIFAGELLWIKTVMDGSPNESFCSAYLASHPEFRFAGAGVDDACQALASDYKTGATSICGVISRSVNDPRQPYRGACPEANTPLLAFVSGEKGCDQMPVSQPTNGILPTCRLLARLKLAAQNKNAGACGDSVMCLQAMGDPSACAPVVTPDIDKACRGYAKQVESKWLVRSMDAQSTLDGLAALQQRLSGEQSSEAARLKAAAAELVVNLKKALAAMAAHRGTKAQPAGRSGQTQ